MKPEIKELWVTALTDGSHKQGHGTLRQMAAGEYLWCCLGVLCDIYDRMNPNAAQWVKRDDYGSSFAIMAGPLDNSAAFLPVAVAHWAGLQDQDPEVKINDCCAFLSSHNDGSDSVKPKTFEQIAAAIKEQL